MKRNKYHKGDNYDIIRGFNKNQIYIKAPCIKKSSSKCKYQKVDSLIFCAELSKFSYNNPRRMRE